MQQDLTPQEVQRRVDDWITRLEHLRNDVSCWAQSRGLSLQDAGSKIMHEDLMSQYGVGDAQMPVFKILGDSKQIALFRPNALFVIGANGRVDVVTSKEAPILVDESRPFSDHPQWVIYRQGQKQTGVPFTREEFFNLIGV